MLSQFSLFQNRKRPHTGKGRKTLYVFDPDHVSSLTKKYFRDPSQNSVSTCPQKEFNNNDNKIERTHSEKGTCPNVSTDEADDLMNESQTDTDTYRHVHENDKCQQQHNEITDNLKTWTDGQAKLDGIQEELFGNGPIDLMDEVVG